MVGGCGLGIVGGLQGVKERGEGLAVRLLGLHGELDTGNLYDSMNCDGYSRTSPSARRPEPLPWGCPCR